MKTLIKLADAFRITLDELVGREKEVSTKIREVVYR